MSNSLIENARTSKFENVCFCRHFNIYIYTYILPGPGEAAVWGICFAWEGMSILVLYRMIKSPILVFTFHL